MFHPLVQQSSDDDIVALVNNASAKIKYGVGGCTAPRGSDLRKMDTWLRDRPRAGPLSSGFRRCKLGAATPREERAMPIAPMLTEEIASERARRPGARRSRDRDGLWHLRRPYRAHRLGLEQIPEFDPHRPGARGVIGRGDGRGLWPADPAPRRAAGPRAVGARQRHDRDHRGASVELADAALDRFQRRPALCPPRALSAGDRRLGQLGRAARLWRRHQAGHAGARPGGGGAGDPARHQACALGPAGAGRDPLRP